MIPREVKKITLLVDTGQGAILANNDIATLFSYLAI